MMIIYKTVKWLLNIIYNPFNPSNLMGKSFQSNGSQGLSWCVQWRTDIRHQERKSLLWMWSDLVLWDKIVVITFQKVALNQVHFLLPGFRSRNICGYICTSFAHLWKEYNKAYAVSSFYLQQWRAQEKNSMSGTGFCSQLCWLFRLELEFSTPFVEQSRTLLRSS